jgi:hypothetical protein
MIVVGSLAAAVATPTVAKFRQIAKMINIWLVFM